jgi:rod shape-determining protein MreC
MYQILEILDRLKDYIVLVLLAIISLALISMTDSEKIGGYKGFVVGSVGWIQSQFSWIPNPLALKKENRALRELNMYLSSEVTKSRKAIVENERMRKMLDFKQATEIPIVSAEVVGKSSVEMRNYITLNRGTSDSIYRGMPVRTPQGLVGSIISTDANYSLVELLTNRNVRVATQIQRSTIDGIMTWEGGEVFKIKNIPDSYDVREGDIVYTSNFSNKYPDNIPVGEVSEVAKPQGTIFLDVTVKAYVDFATLNEVFVVRFVPDPTRMKLVEEIEKRLAKN